MIPVFKTDRSGSQAFSIKLDPIGAVVIHDKIGFPLLYKPGVGGGEKIILNGDRVFRCPAKGGFPIKRINGFNGKTADPLNTAQLERVSEGVAGSAFFAHGSDIQQNKPDDIKNKNINNERKRVLKDG